MHVCAEERQRTKKGRFLTESPKEGERVGFSHFHEKVDEIPQMY